jgi:creatinine amidohydrolase
VIGDEPVPRLGSHTWTEIAALQPLLLVPLGSTEQHGPHLPLDTDTRVAVAVAELAAASAGPGVVVAPALTYGASGEHAGFAGTLSIGTDALTSVLVELARSADHFRGVVWVCAHGGNVAALDAANSLLATEGRGATTFWCEITGGDAHAGRTETSMMLAIAPHLVRLDAAEAGDARPWAELRAEVRAHGVRAISPNGVLGDPAGASAQEGLAMLNDVSTRLLEHVARWADD